MIEGKDKKIEEVTAEKEKVEGEVKLNTEKALKKEIEMIVDKAIESGHVLPADKEKKKHKLFALRTLTVEIKFKDCDKEKSLYDLEIEDMGKEKVLLNFDEHSQIGETHKQGDDELVAKAKKFALDNKISYKEALIEVSK